MILKVFEWPAKVLETRATEVAKFDAGLAKFVADMHETMDDEGGIGLAANQVADLRRVIVVRIPWSEKDADRGEKKEWWHDQRFTFINPVITEKSGKISWQEGCLSFPGIYDFVDRAAKVTVTAQDEKGKTFEVKADGLFAVCLQHEIDHIDGIVFIKRMSRFKSSRIIKKIQLRQLERGEAIEA